MKMNLVNMCLGVAAFIAIFNLIGVSHVAWSVVVAISLMPIIAVAVAVIIVSAIKANKR